jgi:DNA-binding transcriptional ArsR family regulator
MNSVTTILPMGVSFLVGGAKRPRRGAALPLARRWRPVVAYSYQTDWFGTVPVDQLSATFAALADPTRRAILARLVEGEATVNELAAPFPMSAQAVGKHLRVLERAGLIERRRTAQLRPSRLRAVALKDAAEWLDTYREFWEAGFDRMDQRLQADD